MHSIYSTFLEKFQQFEFEEEKMSMVVRILSLGWVMMMIMSITNVADADISSTLLENIDEINKEGPYLGIVVPKLKFLLQFSNFLPHATIPQLDYAG